MVTYFYPGGQKAPYHDRNPISLATTFANPKSIAPHSNATRFTYTVPTKRMALVLGVSLGLRRVTAATTPGAMTVSVSTSFASLAAISHATNTVDKDVFCQLSPGVPVLAGDTVNGIDGDTSTGGTVDYQEDTTVCEFDA